MFLLCPLALKRGYLPSSFFTLLSEILEDPLSTASDKTPYSQ